MPDHHTQENTAFATGGRAVAAMLLALLASTPAARAGEGTIAPEMVTLPAGSFAYGAAERIEDPFLSEELPERQREMPAFRIGRYEVTEGEWQACVEAGGCVSILPENRRGADYPVTSVSRNDIGHFLAWLNSSHDGPPYRLPTEAEWEYAAKAGKDRDYWRRKGAGTEGENVVRQNVPGRARAERVALRPAAAFEPNAWGLHNMLGGVSEFTAPCWRRGKDAREGREDTAGQTGMECQLTAVRGGNFRTKPELARPTMRILVKPGASSFAFGFRLARDLPPG